MTKITGTSSNRSNTSRNADQHSNTATKRPLSYLPQWITRNLRVLVAVAATLTLALVVMRHVRTYGSGSDFWFLWDAAGKVHRGVNPYLHQVHWLEGYRGGPYEDIFLIPAWLMWLIGPLSVLPFRTAWALWSVGNIGALLLSASLALRAGGWRASPMRVALIALILSTTSMAGIELYYGNVDFLTLVCLCGCALASARGRRAMAGVLLGVACALSVQVWAFPIFFLWKRNYRALAFTLGTWVLLGVASCLWFPDAVRTYAEMLRFSAYQWAPFFINQSVYALLLRLFTHTPYMTPPLDSPLLAVVLWGVFCVAIMAVGSRFISRQAAEEQSPRTYTLEFGVSLCLAYAIAPFIEGNNVSPVALVLLAVLAVFLQTRHQVAARTARSKSLGVLGSLTGVTMLIVFVPMQSTFKILMGAHDRSGLVVLASLLLTIPYAYVVGATIILGAWSLRHRDLATALSVPKIIKPGNDGANVDRSALRLPRMPQSLAANFKSFYPRAYLASTLARLAPFDTFNQRRAAVYRTLGFRGIAHGVLILGPLRLHGRGRIYDFLSIGQGTAIATPCSLSLYAPLTIGRRVHFGPEVMVLTGTHEIGHAEERCGAYRFEAVTIGDGAWIGARTVILPGVTIGAGCVIAAGAVVTRDMPPNTLVAGNPARPVQRLDAPNRARHAATLHGVHCEAVLSGALAVESVSAHD